MKKYFWMLGLLMMSLAMFTSCSLFDFDDDDEDEDVKTEMEKNYFRVKNASYVEDIMPQATTTDVPKVSVETESMKGGTNVIRIARDHSYKRIFIGVKGVKGYWVYTPTKSYSAKSQTRADEDEDFDDYFEVTIDNSNGSVNNFTLQVSGEDENGDVTNPYEAEINYTDAVPTEKPTKLTLSYYGESETLCTMKYDRNGRMTYLAFWDYDYDENDRLIEYIDEDLTIDYSAHTITERMSDNGGGYESWTYKYSINNLGYITSMDCMDDDEIIRFSYNQDGYLQQAGGDVEDNGFSWFNGNLVSMFVYRDGKKASVNASYGANVNANGQITYSQIQMVADWITLLGMCGKVSKNLPTQLVISNDGETQTQKFTYKFNGNGTIASEKVTYTIEGHTYSFTVKHSYGTRSTVRSNAPKRSSLAQRHKRHGLMRMLRSQK